MRYAGSKFLSGVCDLVMAENGEEAWQRLNQDPDIELIFTDLMMPVMDGNELIRTIRACPDRRIKQLPILVVTGNEESNARALALDAGATAFISKPFSADDLTGALRVHLEGEMPDARLVTHDADYPPESGLLNNVPEPEYYYLRIEQAFSFHRRQNLDLALMHVKLNNYRDLRKQHGNAWAESVMRNLRYFLHRELRQEDSLHRTSDDLYSVILMGTHKPGARYLVSRLRRALAGARVRFASQDVELSVRFGIQFPDLNSEESPARMLSAAHALFDLNGNVARIR
ncbi:diguanylate cyclase (GGDEF)-like protein [Wenzhouxiangella marina]|nr:diguanylate cyclase (GGDEF)-like protein [Wenzhouxiangella marina]